MKKLKLNKIVFFVLIVLSFTKVQGQRNLNNIVLESTLPDIIGTWISEEDTSWKIVFNSQGICYWYYDNELTETFSYSISTTSPQCGYNVRSNVGEDFYLKLIDQEDSTQSCYEILGVNDENLSLSTIDIGVKYYYFIKQ